MEDDFVGAIKIKDGLFIGDEYAAQVLSSLTSPTHFSLGFRVCRYEQSYSYYQLRW